MPGVIPPLNFIRKKKLKLTQKRTIAPDIAGTGDCGAGARLSALNVNHSHMVDTCIYDYAKLVRDDPSPFARVKKEYKNLRVAVIGAGFAGATAVHELRRAGLENIYVYEARERIGGRADSRVFKDKKGREYINELGPMRVPDNSKLFWHYFSEILSTKDDPVQRTFPNPGIVATEIVYRGLRYTWKDEPYPQPTEPRNPKNVNWKKLTDDFSEFVASLKYNGDDVGSIVEMLQQESLDPEDRKRVHTYWSYFLEKYDEVSFVEALEEFFSQRNGGKGAWGPTEYNMFATLGVGTGGFGPLFPVCFLEIFRLFLWDYAVEYSPSMSMTDIVKRLIRFNPDTKETDDKVNIQYEAVDYVGIDRKNPEKVNIYSIVPGENQNKIKKRNFDYVIIATTLRSMQIRMNLDAEASPIRYANDVFPVFAGSINNMVRESMRIPHIMNSSKLFGFLPTKPWEEKTPYWPNHKGDPIKCVLTDTLARQMYYLDPYCDDKNAGSNVLISYNWGDDSIKIMGIQDYNANQIVNRKANKNFALKEAYETGLETMITDSPAATSLKQIKLKDQDRYLTSVVWQREPMIFGAFKIDYPMQFYYTSQMVYQYHYANFRRPKPGVSQRVFLAGNNVSFQGGWIEGALQSAVNAVSAVLKHMANENKAVDFRMQQLFAPNPFRNVLHTLQKRYKLPALPQDLILDQKLKTVDSPASAKKMKEIGKRLRKKKIAKK